MGRSTPTNMDDAVDSRDILARISELEQEKETLRDKLLEAGVELAGLDVDLASALSALELAQDRLAEWDNGGDGAELLTLQAVIEEAEGYSGDSAKDGIFFIRDSHFTEYARQLADDMGQLKQDLNWPYNCIDWEEAASQLQQDYTSVTWDGVDYWFR